MILIKHIILKVGDVMKRKTNTVIIIKQKTNNNSYSEEKLQRECFSYLADLTKMIYEDEERRENSLIQQATNMQAAFSFVIVAVIMVIDVLIEYRGTLPLKFLLVVFFTIIGCLIISLFAATMAQNRVKRTDFPKIENLEKDIIEGYENFITEAQRQKYLFLLFKDIRESYSQVNDKRCKWVRFSMYSFYAALFVSALGFIATVCKLL